VQPPKARRHYTNEQVDAAARRREAMIGEEAC